MEYYNHIITILTFIVGIAGVIAFTHIGKISTDRAENIARSSAEKGVDAFIKSYGFKKMIDEQVTNTILDGEYSNTREINENISNEIGKLAGSVHEIQEKYDKLDEKVHFLHETIGASNGDEDVSIKEK